MTDPTYSEAMRALFGEPTPDQCLEWLDALCATRTATLAQMEERERLRLNLAHKAASDAFQAASARYGERAARDAFIEAIRRREGAPEDERFNQWLLDTYDWIKEAAQGLGIKNFRKRTVELVAEASGKEVGTVGTRLQRLLDKRKT